MSFRNKSDKIIQFIIGEIMSITDVSRREAFIIKNAKTIAPIIKLLAQTVIAGNEDQASQVALNCLVIISSAATSVRFEPTLGNAFIAENHFLVHIITTIVNNKATKQDFGLLVNLTRYPECVFPIYKLCPKDFTMKLFNYLTDDELTSALITNLSQIEEVRASIVSDNKFILKLFDTYEKCDNPSMKNACISIIRNCCFDTQIHEKLLNPDLELLVKLIMPITGPEEFDDEEMNRLPIDLQYLGSDKLRESDAEIRKLLIESLLLLCGTKIGRESIRDQNLYYLLREYHKWEHEKDINKTIGDVIDILIKKESEINVDNLTTLQIPDDLIEKFNEIDKQLLEND